MQLLLFTELGFCLTFDKSSQLLLILLIHLWISFYLFIVYSLKSQQTFFKAQIYVCRLLVIPIKQLQIPNMFNK